MLDYLFNLYALLHFKGFLKDAILLLCGGTFLLIAFMLLQKLFTERGERRTEQAKHYYLSAGYLYLNDPSTTVRSPSSLAETLALADVIIYMMAEKKEEKHHFLLRKLADQLHVTERLSRQAAESRSWVSRLLAVEKLGFMKLPGAAPLYRELLEREREPHIIAKLLWALSQIASPPDVELINRVLLSHAVISGKFNELIYCNIIKSFTVRGAESELLQLIETLLSDLSLTLQLKRDLVEACGAAGLTASKELLMARYSQFSQESTLKIAFLRAIGSLGGDLEGDLTRPALLDPDWRVRAVAARYAAVSVEAVVVSLTNLLGDSSYHVRINAARSLGAAGEKGRAILGLQLNSEDRFVRDVCTYVLEVA